MRAVAQTLAGKKFPGLVCPPLCRLFSGIARPYIPPEIIQSPKCLNIAIVGAPNSGKSTIVNALVKTKVSAVSAKYNTTRDRVTGVFTQGSTQLVFTDTPGFVPATGEGSSRYVASLVTTAAESIPLSDVVLFAVDAARRWDAEQDDALANVAKLCKASNIALFMVANKIDLLRGSNVSHRRLEALQAALLQTKASKQRGDKHAAMPVDIDWDAPAEPHVITDVVERPMSSPKAISSSAMTALQMKLELLLEAFEHHCFSAGLIGSGGFDAAASNDAADVSGVYQFVRPMFPVCAVSGEGIDDLRTVLMKLAVPRDWEYSRKLQTDKTELERAVEIIREKIFQNLHQEVPYSIRQLNRSFRRNHLGDIIMEHDLLVPRKTVASMLLGRSRAALKAISLAAIQDMEAAFRCKVHLFLHVSVKQNLKTDSVTSEAGGLQQG